MSQSYSLNQLKTQTIEVGFDYVVDRIKRQYEDFPFAFQKEAIQNAWDARKSRKKGIGWKVKIEFIPQVNSLVIEDFGTIGMDEERWKAFSALWKPKKKLEDAGGQGQGKFVLMGASSANRLVVESVDESGKYRCRFLEKGSKSVVDFSLSEIEEFKRKGISPLSHIGTRVWVYNIQPKLLSTFDEKDFFFRTAAIWWQLLNPPFRGEIIFLGKKLKPPVLPPVITSKVVLENKEIKNYGHIRKLILQFHSKPLPEILTGVWVQRAQMKVLSFPITTPEDEFKNRFSGFILFEKDLEKALKKIERSDHCSFIWETPWKEIRALIEEEVDNFKSTIIPKKETREKISPKIHDEIIRKSNEIISEYLPEIISSISSAGPKPFLDFEKKYYPVRIDLLNVDRRQVKYDEPVQPRCAVENDTEKSKKIELEIFLKFRDVVIDKNLYKFRLGNKKRQTVSLPVISLDKSHRKGKYSVKAVLKAPEEKKTLHSKVTSFFLEDKPKPKKPSFVKKVNLIRRLDDPTFRNSQVKDGKITINMMHLDIRNVLEAFKIRKRVRLEQIKFLIIKIVLDEAIRLWLKVCLGKMDKESLDEELTNIFTKRDQMYYEVYT